MPVLSLAQQVAQKFHSDLAPYPETADRKLVVSTSRWTQRHFDLLCITYLPSRADSIPSVIEQMFSDPIPINPAQTTFLEHT